MALTWSCHSSSAVQVPFHSSVMRPPGWIHGHKKLLELSQGLRGSSGDPQRDREHTVSPMSALGTLFPSTSWLVPEGCPGEWGNWGFAPSGIIFGNSQFSLTEKEYSRLSDFSTYAHIVRGENDAGPTWDVPILLFPLVPLDLFAIWTNSARQCTLCLAHSIPGRMTSIEFMIMQVFYSLQMFYLLQWLLIAALTNSVEAKQPFTTAFFFFFYSCVWNKNQSWQKFEYLDSSWLPHLVKFNNSL